MRRPVTTVVAALALALCAGLGLVFLNAYRKGITIHLGESGRPSLPPPPPTASALPDEPQPYTNEQLHSMLQEETSQLGIQHFVPRGEREAEPSEGFLGPRLGAPGTRAQAEAAIREISRLRRSVDAGKKKPVPLSGKTVPVLAAPESGGAAVEPTAALEPPSPEGTPAPLQSSAPAPGPDSTAEPRKARSLSPTPRPGRTSGAAYPGSLSPTSTSPASRSWAYSWGPNPPTASAWRYHPR